MKEYTLTVTDLKAKKVINTYDVGELEVLRTYYASKERKRGWPKSVRVVTNPYSEDSLHDYISSLVVRYTDGTEYRYEEKYDGERRNA